MYCHINGNIELLLNDINRQNHVADYIVIHDKYEAKESNTSEFKSMYRRYYQLNAARLSEEFCDSYFRMLENGRNKEINIEQIVNDLYKLKSNSKGCNAVHFSFATKLAHTINNSLPIYDRMVASFYFFPDIKQHWSKDRKINEYMASYQYLVNEYGRVIDKNLLSPSIERFRSIFDVGDNYSDVKIIDTLIWRYTAFLKSGAMRIGKIQY